MSYVTSEQYKVLYNKVTELSERFKVLKEATNNVIFDFRTSLKQEPGDGFVRKEPFKLLALRYNEIDDEMYQLEKRIEKTK